MIIHGDCLDEMRKMEDNSISAIVTDPPYGLSFMGKGWDHAVPDVNYWKESFRICKPGSFLIGMGGTRTFHRLTCAIEDAGFEIRDCISWIYGSGFPKSHNHFGLEGYGTALKPAWEPCIVAMKPLDGTFKQNAEKWGQAGINIDGCRIGTDDTRSPASKNALGLMNDDSWKCRPMTVGSKCGRWPANVIFDEESSQQLDKMTDFEASRFFYCAKTSSRERNEGLEGLELKEDCGCYAMYNGDENHAPNLHRPKKNNHPTVKPLKLMRYLITLIMPPKDGILLDPFAGSGSTIIAAHQLGVTAIGIEKQAEYVEIARKRLEYYRSFKDEKEPDLFDQAQGI
jgi:site-specific DNA-methyltransferase (adenine-specific)